VGPRAHLDAMKKKKISYSFRELTPDIRANSPVTIPTELHR